MTPEIVEREETIIVGIRTILRLGETAPAALWADQFLPRLGELAPADNNYYCVFGQLPGDKAGRVEYVAGVLTNTFENIPTGMVGWIVPSGNYAVAPAKSMEHISEVCRSVVADWLPDSGYRKVAGPMFASADRANKDPVSCPWKIGVPIETPDALAQLETWFA